MFYSYRFFYLYRGPDDLNWHTVQLGCAQLGPREDPTLACWVLCDFLLTEMYLGAQIVWQPSTAIVGHPQFVWWLVKGESYYSRKALPSLGPQIAPPRWWHPKRLRLLVLERVSIWDVTEKVWLRAMYSDGIAAQTRKTEGDLKNRRIGYHVAFRLDLTPHSMAMAFVIREELQYGANMRE